jgi:hypothetical protein
MNCPKCGVAQNELWECCYPETYPCGTTLNGSKQGTECYWRCKVLVLERLLAEERAKTAAREESRRKRVKK